MKEKIFIKGKNAQEVIALKSKYGQKANIIAGGTDVMVKVNSLMESPECFLYIGEEVFKYIKKKDGDIVIGAATTLSEILESDLIEAELPLMKTVVSQIACLAIRNRATIGGNLCNASPAADTAVPLLAFDAKAVLVSERGCRTVAMDEFFVGPGKTILEDDEILKEIVIPLKENVVAVYKKLGRRKAETLSVVSVCIAVVKENGICKEAKIALGAVAPRPVLASKAAMFLQGKALDDALIEQVSEQIESEISPIDDQRSTRYFRTRASKTIVKILLKEIGE
jgi:CO/xanthine dehydrogenase FAD-binding subunit